MRMAPVELACRQCRRQPRRDSEDVTGLGLCFFVFRVRVWVQGFRVWDLGCSLGCPGEEFWLRIQHWPSRRLLLACSRTLSASGLLPVCLVYAVFRSKRRTSLLRSNAPKVHGTPKTCQDMLPPVVTMLNPQTFTLTHPHPYTREVTGVTEVLERSRRAFAQLAAYPAFPAGSTILVESRIWGGPWV